MATRPIHSLNFGLQAAKIRALFPKSHLMFNQNWLDWRNTITPSPLSRSYDVELIYERSRQPDVYVVSPKLALYPGSSRLPHVYSTDEQRLCLYYRPSREWNSSMFLTDTIIPWTCEWLFHYESWLASGTWQGGGIHYVAETDKESIIQENDDNETKRN